MKTTKNTNLINESNEIIEVRYGDKIYKTWTVKLITPLITKFLKGLYPDSLAVRGLTDIVIFSKNPYDIIPVEIQKTPISSRDKNFNHTQFEKEIRKQLEDNVTNYEKCWQFFDSEYLRYLQYGNIPKNTSINLTWLVKLMRENTLRVFTIKYNGEVRELTTKDFDFLKDISQTCILSCDSDERILNRNKLKIKQNVLFGYNFTQEEISQFEGNFDNRNDESIKSSIYFTKSINKKCKLYGNVLNAIGNLSSINNVLSCKVNEKLHTHYGVTLGLFYQNEFDGRNDYARIQFIDKFNITQYFPGYMRNKEMWDYCKAKQCIFTTDEFRGIVEGREHCLKLIKQQSKSLADYD